MTVYLSRLDFYLDTNIWYAVKPVEPKGTLFFISIPASTSLYGRVGHIEFIFNEISKQRPDVKKEDCYFVSEDQFMSRLTEEEKQMTPENTKKPSFVFFYGGPFSQWYSSYFVIDGVSYSCAEQYMMAMKATVFGDFEALDRIMKAGHPAEQKRIGRTVKNFRPEVWDKLAKALVYRANIAKFSEPNLKKFILGTGDAELVEASPTDRIWGIGLPEGHPDLHDKTKWQGTNWLGEVLMQVRQTLRG